jgi:HD superfamily phosphohydrolase
MFWSERLMVQNLEKAVHAIALQELGRDNTVESALPSFDYPFPRLKLTRQDRMRAFLDRYERMKGLNTKNMVYIEMAPGPWDSPEQVCGLDYWQFFMSAAIDPFWMFIPNGQGGYLVHGKIYQDFCNTREFARLDSIHQLGHMVLGDRLAEFNQTRGHHSLLTPVLAEAAASYNRLDPHLVSLAVAAGITHDIAIAPLSDQGKLACWQELDEEDLAEQVLRKSDRLQKVIADHGLTVNEIVNVIQGRGVIGSLINSRGLDVDKMAYTLHDHYMIQRSLENQVASLFAGDPSFFDIHQDIRIVDDEPVFSNPERAMGFLELRGTLIQFLYANMTNRAKEAFLERELKQMWGKYLNVDDMLQMTDWEFEHRIQQVNKGRIMQRLVSTMENERFVEATRVSQLEQFEQLAQKYDASNTVVRKQHAYNPATHTKVWKDGSIQMLRDVFPERCRRLEKACADLAYVGVYKYYPRHPPQPAP